MTVYCVIVEFESFYIQANINVKMLIKSKLIGSDFSLENKQ